MASQWDDIFSVLRLDHSIVIERGMTDAEIVYCEKRFSFRFPPDLKEFLQIGLPIGGRFPNWRSATEDELRQRLAEPLHGILFDVEHNGFWLDEWGMRPGDLAAARAIVSDLVSAAPTLIPIYAHRMIPDRPYQAGNPVFSVHQTDIICYGNNLRDYFVQEFIGRSDSACEMASGDLSPQIEFWDLERFATRWDNGPSVLDSSTPRWFGPKVQD
jgi:hypothetical protein